MKLLSLTALVIGITVPGLASAENHQRYESDMVLIKTASAPAITYALMRTRGSSTKTAVNVYLNPNGASIAAGWENSARLTSGLVARRGYRSTRIPRYRGTRASFQKLVRCVKDRYVRFNLNIHTRRPSGRYIMAMVGGSASTLGYSGRVGGVAPFNGRIIDNAIVFAFDRNWRRSAALCNTVVHEIGHALGLEHQYLCKDPMSYLRGCGTKTFQNVDAWCGEYGARRCRTGRKQNTHRVLARSVGLRSEPDTETDPEEPDTEAEPPVVRQPDTEARPPIARRPQDRSAPDLKVVSSHKGTTSRNGETIMTIRIWAKDRGGVAKVQLGWANGQRRYVFECGRIASNVPVTCVRQGNYYTFKLRVGSGSRTYAVRVVDRTGNSTVTSAVNVNFGRSNSYDDDDDDGDDGDDGDDSDSNDDNDNDDDDSYE